MKTLTDLFDISHGNKFDLNKMTLLPTERGGINFVGRSGRKRGVSAVVAPVTGIEPYPAGVITVSLGGTRLLSSFIQEQQFYTAQNMDVLTPKEPMTFAEKVYACLCIRHNRFRYSAFGREANRTLASLQIPDPTNRKARPKWFASVERAVVEGTSSPAIQVQPPAFAVSTWKPFRLDQLFEIKKGHGLPKNGREAGDTPYIGALDRNNGLVGYVAQPPAHPAGTLTLNWNGMGGACVAFYQPAAYWCSGDVNALYPRFTMTQQSALFLTTIIQRERYRFGFGRKLTRNRMAELILRLPALADGSPDWEFMENYIKTLPYSSQL